MKLGIGVLYRPPSSNYNVEYSFSMLLNLEVSNINTIR